jgi:rubrerythrin
MAYKLSNKNKITPFEPPCRKTIYNSPEEAQDMIKYLSENRGVGKEIRVYKCNVCGFWHLTSKTK